MNGKASPKFEEQLLMKNEQQHQSETITSIVGHTIEL